MVECSMEAHDDLSWLAPGRKVVLHYTPPHLTPPPSVLADRDHLSSEDAPQKLVNGAPSDPETETKFQPTMRDGHPKTLSQGSVWAPKSSSESTSANRTPTVAVDEATESGAMQNHFRDASQKISVRKMHMDNSGLRRPCQSSLIGTPKYTATVIDASPQHDRAFKHTSTVFIVPQGMELDWLISTAEGQAQVVAGADAARVFLVTLNRGHAFSSAEQVQKELAPWIRTLSPTNGLSPTLNPGATPYTTTPQGIGHRTILIEAQSDINGPIVVEDVRLTEPGRLQPTTFRRMVFLDSSGLIQSEAVLIHTEPEDGDAQRGDGTAHERCENGEGLLRDRPGFSSLDENSSKGGGQNGERPEDERLDLDHRKKTRRKAEEPENVDLAASEKATAERLGLEEQHHWKRARRRHGGSSANLGSEGVLRGSETNLADEGLRFSGAANDVRCPISQRNGARDEWVSDREFESGEDATCPKGADGLNASKETTDRRERQASCTANEGGGFPEATSAGLAVDWDDAVETVAGAGVNRRGLVDLTGVDFSYLASDYLQAMVAGLALLGPEIEKRTGTGGLLDVLVIGLGGGGMPMFLRHHLPCRVEVVEIDPTVVELATTFFGVSQDARFQVHVADAIPWVIAAAAAEISPSKSRKGSFDAVLIDVESAGGQCPPPAFLEPRFLSALRALLRPNGVFAMNVVAPDETKEAAYGAVRSCLSNRLYEWSVPQDSNRVLFSHRTSGPDPVDVSQTSGERAPVAASGETLTCAAIGHVSSHHVGELDDEDAVDLVYWESRLAERGAGMTSWSRGPDLPSLVIDIRTL